MNLVHQAPKSIDCSRAYEERDQILLQLSLCIIVALLFHVCIVHKFNTQPPQ